jgi:hypothetical protein
MNNNVQNNAGIQRIVKKYKQRFRIPENLNFYSKEDYLNAERKFLKFVLMNGEFDTAKEGRSSQRL